MSTIIRLAEERDFDRIMDVEKAAYEKYLQAPIDVFEFRYHIHPEGFWVADLDGEVFGYSTCMRMWIDPKFPPKTREDAIGYFSASDGKMHGLGLHHNPEGNTLYGMSTAVHPEYTRRGVGTQLIRASQRFVIDNDMDFRLAGLRMAGYDSHCKRTVDMSAEEYIKLRDYTRDGQPYEGWQRLFARNGFEVLGVEENYYPEDIASRGYGLLMLWQNKRES